VTQVTVEIAKEIAKEVVIMEYGAALTGGLRAGWRPASPHGPLRIRYRFI
jgi:hypothetical protein